MPAPAKPPSTLALDVVVTGKGGAPAAGLAQSDFSLTINRKPQPIASFIAVQAVTPNAAPVETILLLDAVNTRFSNVAYERQEVAKFLKRNDGRLAQPTSLVILTDTGTRIQPQSTRDGLALAKSLSGENIGLREFRGRAGFYDWSEQFNLSSRALFQLAEYEKTRPGRKLLIWISPGWPLLSGPEVQLDRKQQIGLFAALVHLTDTLRDARITLSSVDPLGTADAISYRTQFFQQFTDGVPDPGHMLLGNLALQVLALQSGGRVLNASNDTAAQIALAASDAEAFYTLTVPVPPADRSDTLQTIAVKVDKLGLEAHTRTIVYAQP